MEINSEFDPVTQAMAQAQEQLQVAMEVQHRETQLQNWEEEMVITWLEEMGKAVVSDKELAVGAAKKAVVVIGMKCHKVSLGFL